MRERYPSCLHLATHALLRPAKGTHHLSNPCRECGAATAIWVTRDSVAFGQKVVVMMVMVVVAVAAVALG